MFHTSLIAFVFLTPLAVAQCLDEPLPPWPLMAPESPRMPLARPYERMAEPQRDAGKISESKKIAPKDVVLRWNEAALFAIRTERTPAPVAARNLALMHTAVYDAVN